MSAEGEANNLVNQVINFCQKRRDGYVWPVRLAKALNISQREALLALRDGERIGALGSRKDGRWFFDNIKNPGK